jgi:hypothetical protein
LRVQAEGHSSFDTTVDIRAEKTTHIDVELELLREKGLVRATSDVPTTVFIDGQEVGVTPFEQAASEGPHTNIGPLFQLAVERRF